MKEKLHSLDAARGLAALSVIVWHYSSVASIGVPFAHQRIPSPPFHAVLWPFYEHGWIAVDLFFCLSGFVFFWLYESSISQFSITGSEFATRRLARLYPLYFVTLLIVAILQARYAQQVGFPFTYHLNNVEHFLLSLFMMDRTGDAFNGPTWSISVEIIVYAIFFLLARARKLRGWRLPLALSIVAIVAEPIAPLLLRGIGGFFLGGVVYRVWRSLEAHGLRTALWITAAAVMAWGLTLCEGTLEVGAHISAGTHGQAARLANFLVEKGEARFVMYIAVPLTVLSLAMLERLGRCSFRWLAWLGDASYALYLIHFPLLLTAALMVINRKLQLATLECPAGFLIFFIILILSAVAVHRGFERPAQTFVRQSLARWTRAAVPTLGA